MPLTDLQRMAHLFRRAGFGATRQELEAALAEGYEATVEELLHPELLPPVEEDLLERYYLSPTVHIPPEQVLQINNEVGFNPQTQAIKRLYDEGQVAIIHGLGYANPNYSHFRSMDI